jgi:N-acyl amino acid synthase of PEP-CTERM/exosortase system
MSQFSIADNFNQYFKIKFASSKELRQEAFKIRYGVYSDELGWEPENEQLMETDECDEYSFHCVLEYHTGVFAGCIRLVIPPANNPHLKLPFEKSCLDSAIPGTIDTQVLPRGGFGELSRLAVLADFRRRDNEKNTPFIINNTKHRQIFTEEERRNFPNIAMGLYLSGVALADICNHEGIMVMMEPRLNRRLRRFGLPFEQIGTEMDYHGRRAMFYLPREKFHLELTDQLKELYDMIYNDLKTQMFFTPYTNLSDK